MRAGRGSEEQGVFRNSRVIRVTSMGTPYTGREGVA
jgi:hypothetical protein